MRGKAFICLPSHHPMRHLPSRRLPSDIAGRLCCSQRALAPVIMLGSSRDASVASAAASRPRALQGRHSDVAVASDMGCAGRRPRSQQRVTARQRASRRRGSSSRAQLHGDRGSGRAWGRCGGPQPRDGWDRDDRPRPAAFRRRSRAPPAGDFLPTPSRVARPRSPPTADAPGDQDAPSVAAITVFLVFLYFQIWPTSLYNCKKLKSQTVPHYFL